MVQYVIWLSSLLSLVLGSRHCGSSISFCVNFRGLAEAHMFVDIWIHGLVPANDLHFSLCFSLFTTFSDFVEPTNSTKMWSQWIILDLHYTCYPNLHPIVVKLCWCMLAIHKWIPNPWPPNQGRTRWTNVHFLYLMSLL